MRAILFLCLTSLFFLPSCQTDLSQGEAIIQEVKQQFVPDRRVNIYDMELINEGGVLTLEGETNLPKAKEAILQKMRSAYPDIQDGITILPTKEFTKTKGVVKLSACNIRSKGKHSAELATQSTLGTPLNIYKQEGDWFYVQTPDGYLGWLDKGGFEWMDESIFSNWQQAEKTMYTQQMGFAYAQADAQSGVVADLLAGNILKKLGEENDFVKVAFPDGRIGFIAADEAMDYQSWMSSRTASADNILATAAEFMGRPYLWGGTSGKGVDCSGFTKSVYYLNGVQLPRDASQQVHTGIEITNDTLGFDKLQKGDLLFFGKHLPEREKITHVAIWLGDGKVIHSAGTVKVESLRRGDANFAEDRLLTFIKAKRIIGHVD